MKFDILRIYPKVFDYVIVPLITGISAAGALDNFYEKKIGETIALGVIVGLSFCYEIASGIEGSR